MPVAPVLSLLTALCAQVAEPEGLSGARALLEAGKTDRALQLLEAELAARPGDAALQRAMAQALERLVDGGGSWLAMSDARDAWDRGRARAPEDKETQRGVVTVRIGMGE
jgi:predicted Zn-dependent protease